MTEHILTKKKLPQWIDAAHAALNGAAKAHGLVIIAVAFKDDTRESVTLYADGKDGSLIPDVTNVKLMLAGAIKVLMRDLGKRLE